MAISSAYTLAVSHDGHQHRDHEFKGRKMKKWRRGWDSNPRYGFPHARFRGECFQPLSHLSAVVAIASLAEEFVVQQCNAVKSYRRAAKKDCRMAAASAAKTPAETSTWWLRR